MFSSFVLAAVTATLPALPVQVETCDILQPVVAPQSGELGGFDTIRGYKLHVRFTDVAAEPITTLVFGLNDGTKVTDAGTFSPRIPIDQTIDLDASDATGCAPQSVILSDGSRLSVAPYIPSSNIP